MAKLIWRVKLVAEADQGVGSESEVARIECDDLAVPGTLGMTPQEAKQMTAALQSQLVRTQVAITGECFLWCKHCGAKLLSKGLLLHHVRLLVRRRSSQGPPVDRLPLSRGTLGTAALRGIAGRRRRRSEARVCDGKVRRARAVCASGGSAV